MKPTVVTVAEMAAILSRIRGAAPCSFVSITTPEQRQSPLGPIKKLVKVNAMTGCHYANALRKATGDHALPERKWGERAESAVVEKLTKAGHVDYYLPVQLNHVSRPLYLVPGPAGRLAAIPPAVAEPFIRQRPTPAVQYRDYALRNLLGVNIGGRRYRIRHGETAA